MFFKLTDEQLMIQNMVRDFAREVLAEGAGRRDRTGEYPGDQLRQMGELGLMGMMIPPEYNGGGADAVSYVLALSEVAYACAATAVVMSVQNSIVCETLYRFGSEHLKQTFLKPLAAGTHIGAFAMTEPGAGSDPVALTTRAEKDDGHYVLNGTKRFITSGRTSDVVIATAKTDPTQRHRGISAFVIPKGTPGLKTGREE